MAAHPEVAGGAGGTAPSDLTGSAGESLTAMRRRRSDLTNRFIAYVNALVADMVRTFPGDPVVDRVKSKVTVCANIKPDKIVANIGEVLYNFSGKIYERDEDFFLGQDFREIAEDATNKEHAKSGLYVANRVKSMYKKLPRERREAYLDLLTDMTDLFLEITDLARALEKTR
jgi:hypothetical protein